jgi:hypothetical protein
MENLGWTVRCSVVVSLLPRQPYMVCHTSSISLAAVGVPVASGVLCRSLADQVLTSDYLVRNQATRGPRNIGPRGLAMPMWGNVKTSMVSTNRMSMHLCPRQCFACIDRGSGGKCSDIRRGDELIARISTNGIRR